MRLDTAAHLSAAVALYRRAGHAEISRYNDNPASALWFERELS